MQSMALGWSRVLLVCAAICCIALGQTQTALGAVSQVLTTKTLDSGALYLLKVTGMPGPITMDGEGPGNMTWLYSNHKDHARYTIVTGAGRPVQLILLAADNMLSPAAITVAVYPLSTPHPQLAAPLESLTVPVTKTLVTSKISTLQGEIYVIDAAGDGKVGGGGLGRGDAEYMDYRADGTGSTDIGDNNTDYGLGLDDTDVGKAPRRHKWGPFRQDHNYYLMFEGTGKPIQFLYYDSNYSDNSPTDTLAVTIYAAP